MEVGAVGLFDLAWQRMEYLSQRQKVVASNIANADQPGYRAKDLRPFTEVLAGVGGSGPARTHESHLSGTRPAGRWGAEIVPGWERSPSGNTVVLEEQISKGSDIRESYALASGVLSKGHAMLRAAIGRS